MADQRFYYDPDDNSTAIFRHLDTNGDGSGTISGAVNGSVTPVDLFVQPAAGEVWVIHRFIMFMEDTGNFRTGHYGVLGAALSNGILFRVTDSSDNVILDLLQNDPIQENGHWGENCYDVSLKAWGAGNEVLLARWTLSASGRPIILKNEQKLKITIQDDLTGLVKHHFHVQGYKGYGKPSNG